MREKQTKQRLGAASSAPARQTASGRGAACCALWPSSKGFRFRPMFVLRTAVLLLITGGCSAPPPEKSYVQPTPSHPIAVATSPVVAPLVKGKAVEYQTDETKSIHVLDGSKDFEEETWVRLSGAVWTFKPNGRFIFAPGMSQEDLFPISGQFFREGSRYVFEGERTVETKQMETGHTEVIGSLDFSGSDLLIRMRVSIRLGDGRVREEDPASIANRFTYEATVKVKRVL